MTRDSQRLRPSPRRPAETAVFTLDGVKYYASISRFADGSLAEIFLDIGKDSSPGPGLVGTALDIMSKDLATLASLALQYGVPEEEIRAALSQETSGEMRGPLGKIFELFKKDGKCVR